MVKKEERGDTAVAIDKTDLLHFNELRAREGGRRGENLTHMDFIRFLLCLYREASEDTLEEARKKAGGGIQ